ncbi:MAG: gamma-glutamyl-gamma-aminobutyrate hydrolase family protein [Lysobacterales bacterium]
MSGSRPWVGVVMDRRLQSGHYFHLAGEKYLLALAEAADTQPVALPVLPGSRQGAGLLQRLDGLCLTGSPSNVEPHRYAGEPSRQGTLHDPERDETALGLIPLALEAGLPLLAVCRGFQELNVALGGTLHQQVHEVPGYRVHKEDASQSMDIQYGPSHRVDFTADGLLQRITGERSAMVNSLHSQAVDALAPGLTVEAVAEDGLTEAFVVKDAPGFTLAVQWHPEWRVLDNPVSKAIFAAFGRACRDYGLKQHDGGRR